MEPRKEEEDDNIIIIIIIIIKNYNTRWVGHVASMREGKSVYRV
jgi:hypothetical protein